MRYVGNCVAVSELKRQWRYLLVLLVLCTMSGGQTVAFWQ